MELDATGAYDSTFIASDRVTLPKLDSGPNGELALVVDDVVSGIQVFVLNR